MKNVFYALLSFIFCINLSSSCKKENLTLGEYVYEDDNCIFHIDKKCPKLIDGNDDEGHKIYAMQPIATKAFVVKNNSRFCVACISEENYVMLKLVSDRNELRKELYDALVDNEYITSSFGRFILDLANENIRKNIYDYGISEDWDLGTFDEFSDALGYKVNKDLNLLKQKQL